jgi:gluconolactonase
MKKACLLLVAASSLSMLVTLTHAQAPEDAVSLGEPKKLHGGFAFTEGPAADGAGNVYFTDIPNERIHVHRVNGALETFMEDSGRCNGLMFDDDGRIWACQGGEGRIITIDPGTKAIRPVADKIEGGTFLSTNDLALDSHGGAYFTDPAYSRHPDSKVDEAVYYVDAKGGITRIVDGLPRPNGILLSPDGSTVYLLPAGQKRLLASAVIEPGKLGPFETLAKLPFGGDGLTCDTEGNLYLTQPRSRSILVVSPEGKSLGSVELPESPSNVAFGGPDLNTLFVTARSSLYSVSTNRTGVRVTKKAQRPAASPPTDD